MLNRRLFLVGLAAVAAFALMFGFGRLTSGGDESAARAAPAQLDSSPGTLKLPESPRVQVPALRERPEPEPEPQPEGTSEPQPEGTSEAPPSTTPTVPTDPIPPAPETEQEPLPVIPDDG